MDLETDTEQDFKPDTSDLDVIRIEILNHVARLLPFGYFLRHRLLFRCLSTSINFCRIVCRNFDSGTARLCGKVPPDVDIRQQR
jgi:hypothetical protein